MEVVKRQSPASNAVFIGKQKLVLLINGNIELSDTETMLSLGNIPGLSAIDDIFEGGVGKFIYRKGNTVTYFDTVTKYIDFER